MVSLLKFCSFLTLDILLKCWKKFLVHLRFTRLEGKKLAPCLALSTLTDISLISFNFLRRLSLAPVKLQLNFTLLHLALKLLLHILS